MVPMRNARRLVLWGVLSGVLLLSRATAAPPLPLDLDDSRSSLSIGEELERSGKWLDAIHHYDRALERWPEDDDLKYGRRRARVHFRIERRYADRSFRESMLTMTQNEALELFDETSRRIRGNFVDSLSHLSIVAHGTESLYIALSDPKFLESNLAGPRSESERQARVEAVREFRQTLRDQYWNRSVHNDQHARQVIEEIARLAGQKVGLRTAPVVMEYVFGGCNALDDYSGFLTSERLADLYSNIDGEFVGLGVEMKEESGQGMLLIKVLPDSPAEMGGLRRGDRIVSIEGTNVRDSSIDVAAGMMRGPVGSRVRIGVYREAEQRTWDAVLIRRAVTIRSIPEARIVDQEHGVAYIQLAGFQKSTAEELDAAVAKLQSEGMKSLILDVRGNPGGLLTAAVEVLDRFIDNGVLVSTKGRTNEQNWTYRAQRPRTVTVPMVLLTDGDSASASEIVAGAVRDHNRGLIVGRKTYGKWSVQSIYNVGRDTGLRLTTARFYSPNGHTLGQIGVSPDVLVELPEEHTVAFRGMGPEQKQDLDLDRAIRILTEGRSSF